MIWCKVIHFHFEIEVLLQDAEVEQILFGLQASIGPQIYLLETAEIDFAEQGVEGHVSVLEIFCFLRKEVVVGVTICKQKKREYVPQGTLVVSRDRRDVQVAKLEDGSLVNRAVIVNQHDFVGLQILSLALVEGGLILKQGNVLQK